MTRVKYLRLTAIPPLLFTGMLLIFYLQVTLTLGHLPLSNGYDDPSKFVGSSIYTVIILLSCLCAAVNAPIFLVYGIKYWLWPVKKVPERTAILILLLLYTASLILYCSKIIYWFND